MAKTRNARYFLTELIIVTLGVLVALFLNSYKEKRDARKYHEASMETIRLEMIDNRDDLEEVTERQLVTLDSLYHYVDDESVSIDEVLRRAGGLQGPTIRNAALTFYSGNQIEFIEYETVSLLVGLESLNNLMNRKLDKLLDYLYPNIFSSDTESKQLFIIYLENVIESEEQYISAVNTFLEAESEKEN